jgi:hypothetical protein
VIGPADDQPHEHGGEAGWEERLVFAASDAVSGYALTARMTHRPRDRTADAELELKLPGGEIARSLSRAQNAKRAELTVGRLAISIAEPLKRWSVACRDVALVLPGGEQRGIATQIDVAIEFEATSEPVGEADRRTEVDEQKFLSVVSRGAFTQQVRARGTLKVGANNVSFDGAGTRERRWGAPAQTDGAPIERGGAPA